MMKKRRCRMLQVKSVRGETKFTRCVGLFGLEERNHCRVFEGGENGRSNIEM